MDEYRISGSTLRNFASAIRSLTGRSEQLSPSEMTVILEDSSSLSPTEIADVLEYANYDGTIYSTMKMLPAFSGTISGDNRYNILEGLGYDRYSLCSVSFPLCIAIGSNVFEQCSALETVSIPLCTAIGESAFYNCDSLVAASFSICTTIGSNAFTDCNTLETASFPICTSIGESAFAYCNSLVSISFPMCTSIESNAFEGCYSLEAVSFPMCMSIGESAFYNCTGLNNAYFVTECTFGGSAFTLDPENGKTFRLYLRGSTIGSCSKDVFGDFYGLSRVSSSGGDSGCGCGVDESSPIAGLEIYVPAELIDEFKTAWAEGAFANNIFPLPDEEEDGSG